MNSDKYSGREIPPELQPFEYDLLQRIPDDRMFIPPSHHPELSGMQRAILEAAAQLYGMEAAELCWGRDFMDGTVKEALGYLQAMRADRLNPE